MKTIKDTGTRRNPYTVAAMSLVTVSFAAGLTLPASVDAQANFGTTYHNPDQTMYVCICDGGNLCTPCAS